MWECVNCGEVHEDSFDMCWRCGSTREGEQPMNFPESDSDVGTNPNGSLANLILSTTSDLQTHSIKKYLGVVTGEAILGANILSDFASGISDIVGGRSGTYESYVQQARQISLNEMAGQAIELSADAVVGIKFDYETIRGTMLMVSCSGTAVKAEELKG